MRARDKLLEVIAREQALIARVERDRDDAQARVRSLQEELNPPAGGAEHAAVPPRSLPPGTAAALLRARCCVKAGAATSTARRRLTSSLWTR